MGEQCTNDLLGPHRPRKTHRTSTRPANIRRKSTVRREPCIQYRPHYGQNVGPAAIYSYLQSRQALSDCFLVCRIPYCRVVCSHQLSSHLLLCSRTKVLESGIERLLHPYARGLPWHNGLEYHHRWNHTDLANAYAMATPHWCERQIGADWGIRRWILVRTEAPGSNGANSRGSVIILSVLRLVSILDQGNSLQKDITCERSSLAADTSNQPKSIAKKPSGNNVFAQILVTCEVPVALISACLPSIFNLAKRGAKHYFPNFYANLSGSHPLNGPGGKHIGPIGNPIDNRKEKGFVQLRSDRFDTVTSTERLYDGRDGASHYTTAFPTSLDREQREEDPEMGIQLHQIHVREDVDIDARRRM